jgi:rare lipoprotein A
MQTDVVGEVSVAYRTMTDPCEGRARSARWKSLVLKAGCIGALGLMLANCASEPTRQRQMSAQNAREIGAFSDTRKYGRASPRVAQYGDNIPKGGGRDHVGRPYRVAGRWYTPRDNPNYTSTGNASWYGDAFHGRKTANGEIYDKYAYTAAHPTMPLPSYARVTNLSNGRSIVVRVNDRGPFHGNRVIDLSERVAVALHFKHIGTARVQVDYLRRAGLAGSDDRMLSASLRTDGGAASIDGVTTPAGGRIMVAGNDQRAPLFATRSERTDPMPAAPPASSPRPAQVGPAAAEEETVEVVEPATTPRPRLVPQPPERPSTIVAARQVPGAADAQRMTVASAGSASRSANALASSSPALSFAPPAPSGASRSAVPIHSAQIAALYYTAPTSLSAAMGGDDPTRRIRPGQSISRGQSLAVGVFRDRANADRLAAVLRTTGTVRLAEVRRAGEVLTELRVVDLKDKETADRALAAARRAGASDARLIGR